jgi:hypothetical protein
MGRGRPRKDDNQRQSMKGATAGQSPDPSGVADREDALHGCLEHERRAFAVGVDMAIAVSARREVALAALLHWRRVAPVSEGVGMIRRRFCSTSAVPGSAFAGFRFLPEIIVLAVRWYLRYGHS